MKKMGQRTFILCTIDQALLSNNTIAKKQVITLLMKSAASGSTRCGEDPRQQLTTNSDLGFKHYRFANSDTADAGRSDSFDIANGHLSIPAVIRPLSPSQIYRHDQLFPPEDWRAGRRKRRRDLINLYYMAGRRWI